MEIIENNDIKYHTTDVNEGSRHNKLLKNLYGSNLKYPNNELSNDSLFKIFENSTDDDETLVFKNDGEISIKKNSDLEDINDGKGTATLDGEKVLFITKKQLREYQKAKTNSILQIKNKNENGFYYVKVEELIKLINNEEEKITCSSGNKIDIDNIDINDAKEVLKTFSQLIETKSHYNKNNKNGTDKVEKKEYLSRICTTGTVPVLHRWATKQVDIKDNNGNPKKVWRNTDHKLLSEKREQYIITYPAWPNFEGSEKEVAEQWKILGVTDNLSTNVSEPGTEEYKKSIYWIDNVKADCYKNYIKEVLELQIQAIKFDGINQLSVTFPNAFLNGIKDKTAKERLLNAFGKAIEEVAEKHGEIEFFTTNSGKYNFKNTKKDDKNTNKDDKNTNKNICLTKGVNAAELNSTKYKIKDSDGNYIEKTINVAYNVTPHDLTEVGNGGFGNRARNAGDENFARNAPLVIAIMGCSKNSKYKELQESAKKAAEEIGTTDKPKEEQEPEEDIAEDNQVIKLEQQIEDYKTEYKKAKTEINNSTDPEKKQLMDNKIKAKSDLVKKVGEKGDQNDIYAQSLEHREKKVLLNKATNEIATKEVKLEKRETNVLVDNFTNTLNNQNHISNEDAEASINSLIVPIKNDEKVAKDILNNEKFKKTVLKPITVKVGDEEKTYDGYGAIMSYDGQKMKIKFKKDGFVVDQLKRMFPNEDDKYKDIINISENGEILFNDNLSQSEFLEFAVKFKHNPINAFLELCTNKDNNVSYTLNGKTETLKDNEIVKKFKETLNIAVECRKTMAELLDFSEKLGEGSYKNFNEFAKDYALEILANPNSAKSREIIDKEEIMVKNPVYIGKQLLKLLKVVNTPADERKEKDKQLFDKIKNHIDGEPTIDKLVLFINESHSINLENTKKKMKKIQSENKNSFMQEV